VAILAAILDFTITPFYPVMVNGLNGFPDHQNLAKGASSSTIWRVAVDLIICGCHFGRYIGFYYDPVFVLDIFQWIPCIPKTSWI
jgi:hypothetical protein